MNKLRKFLCFVVSVYIGFGVEMVNADDRQQLIAEFEEILDARSVNGDDRQRLMAEYEKIIDKRKQQLADELEAYSKSYTKIADVEATHNRSFVLTDKGEIWAWGMNWAGQLGDGSRNASARPVQVRNIHNAIEVSAAAFHKLALLDNGTVMAWGRNEYGQLGDGTTITRDVPVGVQGLPNSLAVGVSAGDRYSVALLADGTVWSWGKYDANGADSHDTETGSSALKVGDDTVPQRPKQVWGLSGIMAVDSSGSHSLALRDDGTVWSWGDDSYQRAPWQVPGLQDIVAISAGDDASLALRGNGTVWAWGDNYYGQLGNGTLVDNPVSPLHSNRPIQVPGIDNAIEVEMGSRNGLVITRDRQLIIWGANYNGQYGNDSKWVSTAAPSQYRLTKVHVPKLNNVKAVSMVHPHVLALTTGTGTNVWSWGGNRVGELGNGAQSGPATLQPLPEPVVDLPKRGGRLLSAQLQVKKSG